MLKTALKDIRPAPYQEEASDYAVNHDLLVVHGTGTGKTLTALNAIEKAKRPAVIVAPKSVVPGFEGALKAYYQGDKPVTVSTYGTAPDVGRDDMLVVDEAHNLRNTSTDRHQKLEDLASRSARMMLLTATPMYNDVADLAPLVNTVARKQVLPEGRDFHKKFVGQEARLASLRDIFHGILFNRTTKLINKDDLLEALKGRVHFYKPDTAKNPNMPKVREKVVEVEMSPEQQGLYNVILNNLAGKLSYKIRNNLPPTKQDLRKLNTFFQGARQVSLSPGAHDLSLTPEAAAEASPKLQRAATDLIRALQKPKGKAFVYSDYLESGLTPYQAYLKKKNIDSEIIHGGLSTDERRALIDRYNKGKLKVLLGSRAAGEGVSLKGTRLVQVLNPAWNEQAVEQAMARGIRYGSHKHLPEKDRTVDVVHYLTRMNPTMWGARDTSADEYLMTRAAEKQQLIDSVYKILQKASDQTFKKE